MLTERIQGKPQGVLHLFLIAEFEQRHSTPAEIAGPEMGEVLHGGLKIAPLPAVFDDLRAYFRCRAVIFFRRYLIFNAAEKDTRPLGEIVEDGGHGSRSENRVI